jgi:hypothetical protein
LLRCRRGASLPSNQVLSTGLYLTRAARGTNLSHAIPVSISNPPGISPAGDLFAEIFWVAADGQLAKELGGVPVQNGVATYQGPPLEPGLRWAIRIVQTATGGPVFRSGPLGVLPGPPSQVIPRGRVSIFHTRVGFGLELADGLPEVVTEHLQSLPWPLRFEKAELGADADGHYVVIVRGRLGLFFHFTYRRALRLVANRDPGRPTPPVLAQPEDTAQSTGVAGFYRDTLDRAIIDAVQAQLAAALSRLASLELERNGVGFQSASVSVSAIEVRPIGTEVATSVTLNPGAITDQILAPTGPIAQP